MYGIEIKNQHGSDLIKGDEETYVFWGKKNLRLQVVQGAHPHHPLFNIPVEWNPIVFSCYTSIENANGDPNGICGYILNDYNGKLHVKSSAGNGVPTPYASFVDFYVFIPAKYAPKAEWGLEIYNDSGDLALSLTRPLLRVKGARHQQYAEDTFEIPLEYKCAVQGSHSVYLQVTDTLFTTFYTAYNETTAGDFGYPNYKGLVATSAYITKEVPPVPHFGAGYSYHALSWIDADVYDGLSSLPDYVDPI